MNNPLLEIANALPAHLDFYHMGHMELRPIDFSVEDSQAIALRIHGDRSATVVVLFEQGLDESMYTEFGNLLGSQVANRLNAENQIDIHISPPYSISSTRLKQMIQGVTPIKKTYVHLYKNSVIPIQTLILPNIGEEIGYA